MMSQSAELHFVAPEEEEPGKEEKWGEGVGDGHQDGNPDTRPLMRTEATRLPH